MEPVTLNTGTHPIDHLQKNNGIKVIDPESKDVGVQFEQIFARHLVEQLTQGLFEGDGKGGLMQSGNHLYRDHIVETLSAELAKQESLGISDMVRNHLAGLQSTENKTGS